MQIYVHQIHFTIIVNCLQICTCDVMRADVHLIQSVMILYLCLTVLFPRHTCPDAKNNTINLIHTLRDYLHYHIKCSKVSILPYQVLQGQYITTSSAPRSVYYHIKCSKVSILPHQVLQGQYINTSSAPRSVYYHIKCSKVSILPHQVLQGQYITTSS